MLSFIFFSSNIALNIALMWAKSTDVNDETKKAGQIRKNKLEKMFQHPDCQSHGQEKR